jgi:phytoene dehydrogenase-like protein
MHYGFRVTVIEGRDRLGGRLAQKELPSGHLVDLGPNWIHGTQDNPMLTLAKQTGTTIGAWDTKTYILDESGKLFPLKEGEAYSGIMWDIVQDAFKYSNQYSAIIDKDESLYDFFHRRVIELIPETEEDHEKKRKIVLQISELWGAFIGSPIERQSLKFFWLEECLEGGELLVS